MKTTVSRSKEHRRIRLYTKASLVSIAALTALFVPPPVAHSADTTAGGKPPAAKPTIKPPAPRSLDEQLLDDLDNDLLEGVGKLPAAPKSSAPKPANPGDAERPADGPTADDKGEPGAKQEPDAKNEPTDETMGEDIGQGPEDSLQRIGQHMRRVEQLIARQSAAEKPVSPERAGQMQQDIVKDLAKLIEAAEKQRQQQGSSSKKSKDDKGIAQREQIKQSQASGSKQGNADSNKPARESTDRLGRNDVQRPDMDQMKGLMKDLWGQLPAHAREQMLQTSPEEFLPRYELLIEKYYKRLAEQQKANP